MSWGNRACRACLQGCYEKTAPMEFGLYREGSTWRGQRIFSSHCPRADTVISMNTATLISMHNVVNIHEIRLFTSARGRQGRRLWLAAAVGWIDLDLDLRRGGHVTRRSHASTGPGDVAWRWTWQLERHRGSAPRTAGERERPRLTSHIWICINDKLHTVVKSIRYTVIYGKNLPVYNHV